MTFTTTSVADQIVGRAQALADLLRQDAYFGRLIDGEVDRDEYAAWLVQMHKYIRHTVRSLHGHADSMAARAATGSQIASLKTSSRNHAHEEEGHDDVILEDLAVLWGVSVDAARGRVEREPTAPSVLDWERLLDVMLARYPAGMIGIGLALETVSSKVSDETRRGLLMRSGIPGIERAVGFLQDHSGEVEDAHTAGARLRAEMLATPLDQSAIFFCGNAALGMFEGLVHFLNGCIAEKKKKENSKELATAGV